jgi:hypothetical protein
LPESRNASYPTFPPPLGVSYSIQIPKTSRLKLKRCRALSSPPLPSARAVYVRTRPQRGLAGVFSISGSHLVRLVPQFESGQNCSDGLHRLGAASMRGLERFLRTEADMGEFIRCQNVKRYRRLLERVTDESDRQQIINLLAEERQKQKDARDPAG